MMENDVTHHNALYAEGAGGLPMPQEGFRGSPREILANISSEKGILGQF